MIAYIQSAPSLSDYDCVSISDVFKEPITIANAYTILFTELGEILKCCDLVTLKKALFRQVCTPDGVELGEQLKLQIKETKSSSQLLDTLEESHCCNWLDTRLIEVLAYSSKSFRAVNLIKAYWRLLFPRKLLDVLSKKLKDVEIKKDYIAAVHAKTKMDPNKITVKDFLEYQWNIEDVIFDLGKRVLNIEHVNKGCLEICYHIPTKYSFAAYKMALHNLHKFCAMNLIYIEITNHPLIYDPWISDVGTHSVKEDVNSQQKS